MPRRSDTWRIDMNCVQRFRVRQLRDAVLILHKDVMPTYCCIHMLNRYRSSAEPYLVNHCSQLEGPALFARRHISTTFPFPVTASGLVGRHVYEPPILPPLPVALPASRPTCVQTTQIIDAALPRPQVHNFIFLCYSFDLNVSPSGIPMILEWEGSSCHRRRGGCVGEGVSCSTLGSSLGRGLCPSQKFFVLFVENTIF